MQKQLAPTGQLAVYQGQLVYETPAKQRVVVEDDRAQYLAQLLPMALTGELNEQQMQMVRRDHDAVLRSVSSQYHELAMDVVGKQQKTIEGLTSVLQTLADNSEPQAIVVKETVGEDFAGKIVFVLSLVLGLCCVSLTTCLIARFIDGTVSNPVPASYNYR